MGGQMNDSNNERGELATDAAPEVSIVIPIHNEQQLLRASVEELLLRLHAEQWSFEVVLAENGSHDKTVAIAAELAAQYPQVLAFSYPEPNYGGALREGIFRARGKFVICEEIDLCDVDFHRRALAILRRDRADLVIGSKAMRGARDHRPLTRRFATRVYNRMLRTTLGFQGTDTHGLKALRREVVAPVAAQCVVEFDVFASEMVIRAQREGLRVLEIPVDVHEKRAPSIRLFRRMPRVMGNLLRLMTAIHMSPNDERNKPLP